MEEAKRNHSFHGFYCILYSPYIYYLFFIFIFITLLYIIIFITIYLYLLFSIYNQTPYLFTNQFILSTLAVGCRGFLSLNGYFKLKERGKAQGNKVRSCIATEMGCRGVRKTPLGTRGFRSPFAAVSGGL